MKFFVSVFKSLVIAAVVAFSIPVFAVNSPQANVVEQQTIDPERGVGIVDLSDVTTAEKHRAKRQVRSFKLKNAFKLGLNKILVKVPKKYKDPGQRQATTALILGIIGIVIYPLIPCSILAIILGRSSLKKYYEGYHDQKGMARAAVILGIIGLSLAILYFGVVFLSFFWL